MDWLQAKVSGKTEKKTPEQESETLMTHAQWSKLEEEKRESDRKASEENDKNMEKQFGQNLVNMSTTTQLAFAKVVQELKTKQK